MSLVQEHIIDEERCFKRQKAATEMVQRLQNQTKEDVHCNRKAPDVASTNRKRGCSHLRPQSNNRFQNTCVRCGKSLVNRICIKFAQNVLDTALLRLFSKQKFTE